LIHGSFCSMTRRHTTSPLFPYTTLFRSIIGPDLDELERLARRVENTLEGIDGIQDVGVFRIKGQSNLEFPIDEDRCNLWGISVRSEEHTSELQSRGHLVCRLQPEKKKHH